MLAGLALIVAGVGIQLTVKAYGRDAEAFRRYSLRSRAARGWRWQRRLIELRASVGPGPEIVVGRLIGAVAIIVGIVFIASS